VDVRRWILCEFEKKKTATRGEDEVKEGRRGVAEKGSLEGACLSWQWHPAPGRPHPSSLLLSVVLSLFTLSTGRPGVPLALFSCHGNSTARALSGTSK